MAVSILLIIGLIVGKVAGKITEKAARKILSKTSLEIGQNLALKDTEGMDSARLVGASLRWFIYLFFIMAAVNTLEFEQLSVALTSLWLWVPNLLAFILIIVIGIIITNIGAVRIIAVAFCHEFHRYFFYKNMFSNFICDDVPKKSFSKNQTML